MRSRAVLVPAITGLALLAGGCTYAQGIQPPPRENYGVQQPRRQPWSDGLRPDGALPEGFTVTRDVGDAPARLTAPPRPAIALPRDIADRLSACWTPPPVAANETMQVTIRVSFRRDGEVIGTPATPFLRARDATARTALRETLMSAIRACTPLRFTPSLGKAIAGRIFAIRFLVHHVASDQRI